MAKIKLLGVDKVTRKLNRSLRIEMNKIFRNPVLRKAVGQIIIDDIKQNVDFGSPSPDTLNWRERYDPINKTDPAYQRNKLNAVFTGELLEDLKNNVKGFPTKFSFEIGHSKKLHKKYQGVTKKIGKRTPYDKISQYLIDDLGYNYFQLSKEAKEDITELVREEIFKLLTNVK